MPGKTGGPSFERGFVQTGLVAGFPVLASLSGPTSSSNGYLVIQTWPKIHAYETWLRNLIDRSLATWAQGDNETAVDTAHGNCGVDQCKAGNQDCA